jgi:protein-tyrosine kinase
MGRVYNALVKADRLPDRERPIGRPASNAAEVRPTGVSPARTDAATKNTADFPLRQASSTLREDSIAREDSIIEFSFNYDGAATAPTFQSDGSFNLTETPAAPRAAEASSARPDAESFSAPLGRATQSARRASSPAPTASQPPAHIFEEPRRIANVKGLTIDPHLAALTAEDALAVERYRSLAVRVINAASRRKLKTLVVTSAEEGEGKSTVAAGLAWAMAKRSERRVLLIDASLSSRPISRLLGLDSPRGWLDVADDLSGLADLMVRLDPNGLYVMARRIPSTEAERQEAAAGMSDALISSRFEKLLAGLDQRFDFIVIDAPHVLGSADAQRLASIADGTVIVARSGVTRNSRVTAAIALVPEDRRVGIVLNESEVSGGAAPHKAHRSLIDRLFRRKK